MSDEIEKSFKTKKSSSAKSNQIPSKILKESQDFTRADINLHLSQYYSCVNFDYTNGFRYCIGNSFGGGLSLKEKITTICEPFSFSPLSFYSFDSESKFLTHVLTWDEVWELATDEEKLILILWIPLK